MPVGRIDAGIRNRITAVDHHSVADIDANVRRADGIIGFFKEDQVTRLCICRRNVAALATQSVCRRASDIPAIATVIDDPADKAGAVKTGAWRTAAPHIRQPDNSITNPCSFSYSSRRISCYYRMGKTEENIFLQSSLQTFHPTGLLLEYHIGNHRRNCRLFHPNRQSQCFLLCRHCM